jgi:hypothetical protein
MPEGACDWTAGCFLSDRVLTDDGADDKIPLNFISTIRRNFRRRKTLTKTAGKGPLYREPVYAESGEYPFPMAHHF